MRKNLDLKRKMTTVYLQCTCSVLTVYLQRNCIAVYLHSSVLAAFFAPSVDVFDGME